MFFTSPQQKQQANASPVEDDDARVIFGKTLLVPDFDQGPSPTDIWSRDMLPRLSMRPKTKLAPPPPPATIVKETDGYLQLDSRFRVPQKQPEDEEKKPQQPQKPDEEDEFIKTIAKRRGWGEQLPTNNPHVMHALLKEPAAFKRFPLTLQVTGVQIAQQVNVLIYTNPKFTQQQFAPQSGDVVVLGLPRSGQTCVLRILDMLQTHTSVSANTRLLENTVWHENPNGTVAHNGNVHQQQQRRIVKSHLSIHQAIASTPTTSGEAPPRFIIVLRNPGDLRLSMYRHIRRVYTKCTNTALQSFDDVVRMEEFAGEIPGFVEAPEAFTASALRAVQYASHNNVLIVFYEEVLAHPLDLVHRIAHFTNYMRASGEDPFQTRARGDKTALFASAQDETMVRQITEAITTRDDQHPINLKRTGSSGQSTVCFSERELRNQWGEQIKQFAQYDALYAAVTGKPYLFSGAANTELKKEEAPKTITFTTGVRKGSLQPRRFGSFTGLLTSVGVTVRQRRNTDLSALKWKNEEEEEEEISFKPRKEFKRCNDPDDIAGEVEMDFEV